MSYGIVLTDDLSRQGIIDAFKRRHCYAATDNIILEFRCGKHIMGDIFNTTGSPKFDGQGHWHAAGGEGIAHPRRQVCARRRAEASARSN